MTAPHLPPGPVDRQMERPLFAHLRPLQNPAIQIGHPKLRFCQGGKGTARGADINPLADPKADIARIAGDPAPLKQRPGHPSSLFQPLAYIPRSYSTSRLRQKRDGPFKKNQAVQNCLISIPHASEGPAAESSPAHRGHTPADPIASHAQAAGHRAAGLAVNHNEFADPLRPGPFRQGSQAFLQRPGDLSPSAAGPSAPVPASRWCRPAHSPAPAPGAPAPRRPQNPSRLPEAAPG